NVAMVEAAAVLAGRDGRLAITHQTGERDLAFVRDGYRRVGLEARIEPFLYEMHREMTNADVVISRAGATTLAELAARGRASILVPLPTAADDHQRRNAEAFARAGAAEVIDQRELNGSLLAARLVALAEDPARRESMAAAARRFARPDAARVIVDRALALTKSSPETGESS
ncbi:MAG TPA: glycosyltransferase, partial [Vicinamibacterales bacterium]|nr:glycosyltransferase [Vicinamibacterales bacterium]